MGLSQEIDFPRYSLKNVLIDYYFSGGGCLLEPNNDVGHLYLQHRSDCQNNLLFFVT
jgi:hypothetical protein